MIRITPEEAFPGAKNLLDDFETSVNNTYYSIQSSSDYDLDGTVSTNELLQGFHDYICDTCYYDYAGLNAYDPENSNLYIFTPCGVFLPDHGTGVVCEGYSRSFKILCEKAGIPCVMISGKTKASSTDGHMWNAVAYHDTWYLNDLTWDDPSAGKQYQYFMCGSIAGRIEDGQLSGGDSVDPDTGYMTRAFTFAFPQIGSYDRTFTPYKTQDGHCVGVIKYSCNEIADLSYWEKHTPQASTIDPVEPTCTEDGWSASTVCSVCEGIISDRTSVPATGHIPAEPVSLPATCTQGGYTGRILCDSCHEILDAGEDTPATGHQEAVTVKAKVPTCTEDGCTQQVECSTCGAILQKSETIPATGHQETVTVKAKAPTCTENGCTQQVACSTCGAVLQKSETISATGHQEKMTIEAKAPTCTENGCTQQVECSVCNEILQKSQTVPAAGHKKKVTLAAKAATCTQDGCTQRVECTVCGKDLQESRRVPASGHVGIVTVKAKAPTCTKAGNTREFKCSRCGKVLEKSRTVPATGHTVRIETVLTVKDGVQVLAEQSVCTKCSRVVSQKVLQPVSALMSRLKWKSVKLKGKNTAKLRWKKKAYIQGYEIQYSKKKSFKKYKTVVVTDAARTSLKIKKLKRGKTYYFRIRSYLTIKDNTVYSKWSKKKKIRTK